MESSLPKNSLLRRHSVSNPEEIDSSSTLLKTSFSRRYKNPDIAKLIKTISLKEDSVMLEEEEDRKQVKKCPLNLMKLLGKDHKVDSNIFSVTVGQIMRKDSYKQQLQSQIDRLKLKLTQFKSIEEKKEEGQTRSSLCGRIYKRDGMDRPKTSRVFSLARKGESDMYRWNPKLEMQSTIGTIRSALKSKGILNRKKDQPAQTSRTENKTVVPRSTQTQIFQIATPDSVQKEGISSHISCEADRKDNLIREFTSDFRTWIDDEVNVPKEFPLPSPSPFNSQEENALLLQNMYILFGMDLDCSSSKLISKKYLNCIYGQFRKQVIVWYYDGSFYIGGWNASFGDMGVKEGQGFQYIPRKHVYKGQFVNGQRSGDGVFKSLAKNGLICAGLWRKNKMSGRGRSIDLDNLWYIGDFIDGQKTGLGKMKYPNGQIYDGNVQNGRKHGRGFNIMPNGDTYEGYFIFGLFDGRGVYKWVNGNLYDGEFSKGMRHGEGIWQTPNGERFEGQYVNDRKHGQGRYTWASGEKYWGGFMEDLREGEGFYSYPNGKIGKFLWQKGSIAKRLFSTEEEAYKRRRLDASTQRRFD